MGAGGSSLAMSVYFTQDRFAGNMPSKIILSNRSQPRLDSAKKLFSDVTGKTEFEFVLNPTPADNDVTMEGLKPYSFSQCDGTGKDPGSSHRRRKISGERASVEINHRGELLFKDQAEAQAEEKTCMLKMDGFIYSRLDSSHRGGL